MNQEFDYVKFSEDYAVCIEETVEENELEEKEELQWDVLSTK